MKLNFLIFFHLALFWSCTKLQEPLPNITNKVEISTSSVNSITSDSVKVGGIILKDGGELISERGFVWGLSSSPTTLNFKLKIGSGIGSFSGKIDSLLPNTTYYTRSYAINIHGTVYGNQLIFKTLIGIPRLKLSNTLSKTPYTAKISSEISLDGGAEVLSRGICINTKPNPNLVNNLFVINSGKGAGYFESLVSNLLPNTTYYIKAFATNQVGTAYGKELIFTTDIGLPKLKLNGISDITGTSAIANISVLSGEGANVTKRGICWSTTPNPTISNNRLDSGGGLGDFQIKINSLLSSTNYYVRAYAENLAGISYSDQITFKTNGVPDVRTLSVRNISFTSIDADGSVISDGGAAINRMGFCWNTSGNPTLNDRQQFLNGRIGDYTINIGNLSPNTTYFIRSFAVNEVGVGYGNTISFKTNAYFAPVLSTLNVNNIQYRSAVTGGNISNNGGLNVFERGICWAVGNQSTPTINSNRLTSGSGNGDFVVTINNLDPGTTYSVRAYAINDVGVSYGQIQTFTTLSTRLANVSTTNTSEITTSSVRVTGNVLDDGGANVSSRGFQVSKFSNFTDLQNSTSGSGTGSFNSVFTGLENNTLYYTRSWATNSNGTAFGNIISFRTLTGTLPTVSTSSISSITTSSAILGVNVTSDGGIPLITKGVCWSSTTSSPTITSSNRTTSGTTVGTASYSVTGLTRNTTYYVRAFATNGLGTTYGQTVTFRTSP